MENKPGKVATAQGSGRYLKKNNPKITDQNTTPSQKTPMKHHKQNPTNQTKKNKQESPHIPKVMNFRVCFQSIKAFLKSVEFLTGFRQALDPFLPFCYNTLKLSSGLSTTHKTLPAVVSSCGVLLLRRCSRQVQRAAAKLAPALGRALSPRNPGIPPEYSLKKQNFCSRREVQETPNTTTTLCKH